MKKARFSEEQTTYALKQVESGKPVGEVCRQLGVSEQSFYRWRKKYQGIGAAKLRSIRAIDLCVLNTTKFEKLKSCRV